MHRDTEAAHPDREGHAADLSPGRQDGLSWFRGPLTIRHLCALGMLVVGGGIPIAGGLGERVSLGYGLMVITILAMAMAHDGGWTRKRHRPLRSAPNQTRKPRYSSSSGGGGFLPRRGTKGRGTEG